MTAVVSMRPRLIDISPALSAGTPVWPGDQSFERHVSLTIENGDPLELSSIISTVHIGAHADAPSHYRLGGAAIDQRPLDLYFGPCQVVAVTVPAGARIGPEDLPSTICQPRVLFRTDSFNAGGPWREDFNSLSPELVHHLADRGVRLVGIDTPSVDPQQDQQLHSHQAIADRDMAILEGLDLAQVECGSYTLIALPLRLVDADASPVRAVLCDDLR